MNSHEDLIKILKTEPQWLMINQSNWTFLPWALFNCFGTLEPEENETVKALKALLNENPKILVLSSNPKKLYTNNLLNLIIEGFQGREHDSIITNIIRLNNWSSDTDISIGRLRPIYGSLQEFIEHYNSILANFNPSHVIIDGKVVIDTEFDSKEKKTYDSNNIKDFYQAIKDQNGLHRVKKLITDQHFLAIPYDQISEGSFLYSYQLSSLTNFSCRVDLKINKENMAEATIEYSVPKNFLNNQHLGKFKVRCYHSGLLKLKC